MENNRTYQETKGPDTEDRAPKGQGKKNRGMFFILLVILVIALFLGLIGFLTDWLWFKELDYVSVFFKKLFTQLKIGIPVFVIVTLLTYVYLKFIKNNYYKNIDSNDIDRSTSVNKVAWGLSGVFGVAATYFCVTTLWFEALQFFHSQDFGLTDPIFGLDISFYVFKLDFINHLNSLVIGGLVLLLVITIFYYTILLGTRKPQIFESAETSEGGDPFAEEDDFEEEPDEYEEFDGATGETINPDDPISALLKGLGVRSHAERKAGAKKAKKKSGGKKQLDNENIRELLQIGKHQLTVVGVVFFIMLAVHYFLKQFTLLYTHTGAVYGAGFTDVNITLWVYRVLMVLALAGAVAVVLSMMKKKLKPVLTIPVIMIAVGILGTGAAMVVQNFVVSPDEIAKESKYLERNIEYTQYAYDLQDVTIKPFAASNDLSSEDIQNNDPTISNIRINDYSPTNTFYNQTQSIRQYYTFPDVDVDRYMINGDYTQTFLATREIDEEKISNTWINTHLKYTHGYGITLSRVDKITASGQPDMLIDSIPPVSKVEEIDIERPEVYFGELTNTYVIVGTNEDEFDFPDGDSNKYTRYEGTAGIKLNPINRLMFAIREHSMKLLVSSNIKGDSRIIINRNVEERVKKIMPYIGYESDPYMCTVDGRLYWIIDAYTTSDKFPYSEPYSEESTTNYVRNSIKVVVDAYNGTTDYYIVDPDDAIAQTYAKIYPKLFKTMDQMPEGLQAHIRYPNTMFAIQANVYRRYHMNDVKVFYQNEDLWDVSNEIYGMEEQAMTPNYYIMNLPGETTEEFVNTIPYTPRDKKNMTGLLLARNDGEHYGELVLFQLPKSKIVYGPMQIEAQIDQSTEISKEFSLWNSSGSKYSRGNLFVIPIEDSLLYVEPVYLEASNSSIPEVKRVIVAYGDKIAYEATLSEALDSLFGEGSSDSYREKLDEDTENGGEATAPTQAELIEQAQAAYDAALEAQKNGDWAGYGQHLEELGDILEQLENR